jgi:hypothetical protein
MKRSRSALALVTLSAAALVAPAAPTALAAAAPATTPAATHPAAVPAPHTYPTNSSNVHVRTLPTQKAATVRVLGRGVVVTVVCWTTGSSVRGDNIWYHSTRPAAGFVPGAFLRTGKDPNRNVRHC